jgi:hypothetical protein
MKKVVAAILTASLVAGGLFALDLGNGLKIDGIVATGVRVETQDDGDSDTKDPIESGYNADNQDTAGVPVRAQITFAYTTDQAGIKIRLRDDITTGKGTFVAQYAYGWANLFDNLATVYAGRIGPAADIWGNGVVSNTIIDKNNEDSFGTAARLEVKPIDGLSLGVIFALPSDGVAIGDWFGGLGIGAKYNSDAFGAVASVRLFPEVENVSDSWARLLFAVKANLDPLTIAVEGEYASNDKDGKNGEGGFGIGPVINFAISDALSAHVQGLYYTSNDTIKDGGDKDNTSDLQVNGAFETEGKEDDKATSFSFEAGVGYDLGNGLDVYFNLGSDNITYIDGNGLYIQPGLNKKLSDNAAIKLWDKINGLGADEDIYGKALNTLQLDFAFTF